MTDVPQTAAPARPWRALNITWRTTLLAWLVTIGTLLVFAGAIVPEQKRTFVENLRSKAHGIAVSLRDVAAGAAVSEDYSSIVDQCVDLLKGDPALDYIILTRNDGFSLIHDRSGWRSSTLGPEWHPPLRVAGGDIGWVPLVGRRVYHFSQPFEYSGIQWGWIHVGLSLDSYDRSVARVYWRTALLAVFCMLIGLIATTVYAKHLVRPILALQSVVRRVAGGDLTARAASGRGDELGQLATSVNAMTEALLRRDRTLKETNESLERRVHERTRELQEQVIEKERTHRVLVQTQQHLIEASRAAGRAEIATGVLHSVGNVLNSVNVSVMLLQDQLGHSNLDGLVRAIDLLNAHHDHLADYIANDPHGRHIAEFLTAVVAAIATEHESWRAELTVLAKNVEHIKEIVATQQSYARIAGVCERTTARELVEEAISINQPGLADLSITVVTQFQPTPDLVIDKHKVLSILVNLVSNAKWAVEGQPKERRKITLVTRQDGDRVAIAVTDTGVGITPENLPRIFRHGFTTRSNGHGFGLHIGALAASDLGGSLTVHSDGPGLGATFELELPAAPQPVPPKP